MTKILIIDDEPILRQSIASYLEDSDFEILQAKDGSQGLEILRQQQPDLVLTDLQMPEVGGLEVLEIMTKEMPDIPVIVISGVGGMSDVIQALRLGAWDYITKPVNDLAVLEHALNKALERCNLLKENKTYEEKLSKNLAILEEDQQAGRSVQLKLLPTNNLQFKQYMFSHSVVPSLYLSGDFVDYFSINDSKVGFYLADVSGHGASSAFVTVLLKSLVARITLKYTERGDTTILLPELLMEKISFEIYSAKLGKYMTMVYGVLDLDTNECIYGIAGHYPSPILLKPSGEIHYLPGRGFPVGIMKTVHYQSQAVTIPKGGNLILFSDGVLEIFMAGKDTDDKQQGLLALVRDTEINADNILEALGIRGKSQAQPDDITILTISHN